jgi:putative ABC transport system permease protein
VRLADVLRLALGALWRQKVRTLLTVLGVVFGGFVLVISLSIGQGVQDTILRQAARFGDLRLVEVQAGAPGPEEGPAEPVRGAMSDERRERLERQLARQRPRKRRSGTLLTPERLRELAKLEHVRSVTLAGLNRVNVRLGVRADSASLGVVPADDAPLRRRLIAGGLPGAGEALVDEVLLYRLGVADDADLEKAVGKRLHVEFPTDGGSPDLLRYLFDAERPYAVEGTAAEQRGLEKLARRLPEALNGLDRLGPDEKAALDMLSRGRKKPRDQARVGADLTIRGVLRAHQPGEESRLWARSDADADLLMPSATAEELYARLPSFAEGGYGIVLLEVDDLDHVREVSDKVQALGLSSMCMLDFIEQERFTYLLIFSGMTVVALVALAVAALGIANTMLISVLERVREIGVMKAVGARDGHVLAVFLVEGAVVGLVGGVLGLLLAWGVSFPADAWMRGLLASRTRIKLEESVFAFPWWLIVSGPAFACLVTTLAAFYPARRAARIDPVTALRHE